MNEVVTFVMIFLGKSREIPQTKFNQVCVDDMRHLHVLEISFTSSTGLVEDDHLMGIKNFQSGKRYCLKYNCYVFL